jgi:hypothetical protein
VFLFGWVLPQFIDYEAVFRAAPRRIWGVRRSVAMAAGPAISELWIGGACHDVPGGSTV